MLTYLVVCHMGWLCHKASTVHLVFILDYWLLISGLPVGLVHGRQTVL